MAARPASPQLPRSSVVCLEAGGWGAWCFSEKKVNKYPAYYVLIEGNLSTSAQYSTLITGNEGINICRAEQPASQDYLVFNKHLRWSLIQGKGEIENFDRKA